METVSKIEQVRSVQTRGGSTRFVVLDSEGREYTTFREPIGRHAQELRGTSVRIHYHEEQRGQYRNVYVDRLEPVTAAPAGGAAAPPDGAAARPGGDTDIQEAAWRTAVEAAPWLVGEPASEVAPAELYDKLKPFEARVARDIEAAGGEESPENR